MGRVAVTALLSLREELGWRHREVELEGETLRDLLRSLRTENGSESLEKLMCAENGNVRDCYVVMVNGVRVKETDIPLNAEDRVVTTQFFRAIAGG